MSTFSLPPLPHSMKKTALAVFTAVIVGHIGVLWAVSHFKVPENKPVEKQRITVRLIAPKQEQPKVEPKQQPTPPKEVKKVVEPVVTPPPIQKKIETVQQVKKAENPKPVVKTVETVAKPVVEKTVVTKTVVETPVPPKVEVAPAVVAEQAVKVAEPVVPKAPPAPKRVSIGGSGVQWSRTPKPKYTSSDLQGETRTIIVLIDADENGNITNATLTRSSGITSLDNKILRSVRGAKFKPYTENGVAYPIRAEQPFELTP